MGGMELPVLALSSGMWDRKAKGERNETAGRHECNGMKEAPAAGIGRKTIHDLHLRRVVGLLWFKPAITILIEKMLIENWVGRVYVPIVHRVILWQSSRFSGVRLEVNLHNYLEDYLLYVRAKGLIQR